MKDPANEEYLKVSATYGRFKYEIIEKAFTAVLLGYYGDKTGNYDKKRIKEAITRYDELWKEWKQFKDAHKSCATLYEPNAFQMTAEGVSGDKKRGLGARINRYREIAGN